MNGVEILNTIEVGMDCVPNWWACGFAFLLCIMIAIVITAMKRECAGGAFVCGTVIGLLVWGIAGLTTQQPTTYETYYQVIIDDSVSMNEFLDKYEILDQEGKIYTVKERE